VRVSVACAGVGAGLAIGAPAFAQQAAGGSEPGPAAAAAPAVEGDARQLLEEAKRLYEAERYAEALDMFERVYALQPNPAVLFNLGAVHAALHHCALARDAYRRYIEQTRLESGRADALEQLSRLNDCEATPAPPVIPALGPAEAAGGVPASPPALAVPPEAPAPSGAATPSASDAAPPMATPSAPSSGMPPLMTTDSASDGMRIAGWVAIGTGGVLGIASVGYAYASSRADDADSRAAPGQTGDAAAREQDAGRRYNTLAWGLAGGAAALVGSGLILLWLQPDDDTSVQVGSAGDGLGLSFERRF
jgi:hypothetical protein